MEQYKVKGMSCAACSARVEKAVSAVDGVTDCTVSLLTNSMSVEGTADAATIIRAVEKAGYKASKMKAGKQSGGATDEDDALKDTETPLMRKRLIASVVLLIPLMYLSMGHMMWNWPLPPFFEGNHVAMGLVQLLFTVAIMVVNQKFFVNEPPPGGERFVLGGGAVDGAHGIGFGEQTVFFEHLRRQRVGQKFRVVQGIQ
jgi:Cu2+-exporting ATPase